MKSFFLCALIFAAGANAADSVKEPFADATVSKADMKAMQGHLDAAMSKAVTDAIKAEVPPAPYYQSTPAYGSVNTDIMTSAFIEAKVPDCLHSEGLKRQPTFFMTGFLALPFIAVAKLRGKCI